MSESYADTYKPGHAIESVRVAAWTQRVPYTVAHVWMTAESQTLWGYTHKQVEP